MTPIASSSRSRRTEGSGNSPVTCSFNRSPAPTASVNGASDRHPTVAAAWATIAGW